MNTRISAISVHSVPRPVQALDEESGPKCKRIKRICDLSSCPGNLYSAFIRRAGISLLIKLVVALSSGVPS